MGEKAKDMNSVSFSDFTNCKNFRNLINYLKILKNSGKVFTICEILNSGKAFTIFKYFIKFRKSFYNL